MMELNKAKASDVSLAKDNLGSKIKKHLDEKKLTLSEQTDLSLKGSVDVEEAGTGLVNTKDKKPKEEKADVKEAEQANTNSENKEVVEDSTKFDSAKASSPKQGRKATTTDAVPRKRGPRPMLRTSKYRGVSWFRANKVWKAQITVNGKYEYLGYFDDESDAAWAYDIRALEVHGPLAQLNFPNRIPELMKASASGIVPGKIKPKKGRKRGRSRLESVEKVAEVPPMQKPKLNIMDGKGLPGPNMYTSLALQAAMNGLAQQRAGTEVPNFGMFGNATSPIQQEQFAALTTSFLQQQGIRPMLSPNTRVNHFTSLTPTPSPTSPSLFLEQRMRLLQQEQDRLSANGIQDSKRRLAIQLLAKLNVDSKMIAQVINSSEVAVRSWFAGTSNDTELADKIMWFLQKLGTDSISSPLSSPLGAQAKTQSASEKNLRSLLLMFIRQLNLSQKDIQTSLSMSPDALQKLLADGTASVSDNLMLSDNLRILSLFVQIRLKQAGMNEMAQVLQTAAEAANVALPITSQ